MTRIIRTILLSLAATVLATTAAHAACAPPLGTVFAGYGDPNLYAAVPDAGFEGWAPGWTLTQAAVAGDTVDGLGLGGDLNALRIEPGGVAVSAPFCVTRDFRGVRMFSRALGAAKGGGLQVTLVVNGKDTSASVVAPTPGWALSPSLSLLNRTAGLGPDAQMDVQLRFRNVGKAAMMIDDVYVDPRLKR